MIRNLFLASFVLLAFTAFTGCGSDGPSSVVDSSDTDAMAEYDALIKAEEEAASGAMEATANE